MTKYRCDVSVAPGILFPCLAEEGLHLHKGEEVIVHCERFEDFGRVTRICDQCPADEDALRRDMEAGERGRRIQGQIIPNVVRRITLVDKGRIHENEVRAKMMLRTVVQRVQDHRLPMKVTNVHLVFDASMLVVQFTAEGRVDFRDLLRDLSRALHLRVELHQIGVRDEASIHGGIGSCGRPFCCALFLKDFQSINVRLAKEQGLSLNPANISGACGRLKCCLRYEAQGYKDMLRDLPRVGNRCETPKGPGKVIDVNPLTRRLRVLVQGAAGDLSVADFAPEEITVKRPPPAAGGRGSAPPAEQGEED